jgi:hypothetical protein
MSNPSMLTGGHTTAPKFSPDQPHELYKYFEELEVLFATSGKSLLSTGFSRVKGYFPGHTKHTRVAYGAL